MDFETAAKNLITALDGRMTDENIAGVMHVFNTIIEMHDLNWEQWVTAETNDSLAKDNILCECGRKISIQRQRSVVYVDIV